MKFKADTRITTKVVSETMFLEPNVTKDTILKKISEVGQKAFAENCTEIYLYYTGHGCADSGAWMVHIDKP